MHHCVDDAAEDFRVDFGGPQTVTVDGNTCAISIGPLSSTNRRAPVEITAQVIMEKADRPELNSGAATAVIDRAEI